MSSPRYFVRAIHGIEPFVEVELVHKVGARALRRAHRTLFFESSGSKESLLDLRSVDDVFQLLQEFDHIPHTRAALLEIETLVASFDWRSLMVQGTYSVTASFVGKRNYSRWDLAAAVQAGIARRCSWRFIDGRESEPERSDLHLRLLLEHDHGALGLRLGVKPLYQRDYKKIHHPGSLHPPLAYVMASLANTNGGVFLDPACGVGTIPIEARSLGFNSVLASDIDQAALSAALQNDPTLNPRCADLGHLPFADSSIDAIATDLPWGNQTALHTSLPLVVTELRRVLRPGARAVLMIEEPDELMSGLKGFKLEQSFAVSLFGRHPTILVLSAD